MIFWLKHQVAWFISIKYIFLLENLEIQLTSLVKIWSQLLTGFVVVVVVVVIIVVLLKHNFAFGLILWCGRKLRVLCFF